MRRTDGKLGRILLVGVLAVAVLASGCSRSDPNAGGPPATAVKMETARSTTIQDSTEYVAQLKSRNSAVISPQVEGQVVEIFVHSGDRVAAGAPLMQIDPLKQQATVRSQEDTRTAKEAAVVYARQQYERTQGLYEAQVASKQDLDAAKTALDSAEAELRALDAQVKEQQVQLHYYRVAAPTNGIVGDIPVHVGDRVTTSTVLTTVDKPGPLEVYVEVPVERSGQLKLGLPLEVLDSGGNVVGQAKVDFISPEVSNQTQTVLVKANVANPEGKLRTAQFIRARAVWGTRQTPVIPVLAVERLSGQYFAFVAEPSGKGFVARQRPLKLGEIVGNDYVVLEGLQPGDRIIVSGGQNLVDGAPVTAAQ
ncbi:MAG TPA: efflux RND transporter periplasmic adaptor subunit [Terriglobales bacterium]|jgi:RND family efflux transporter MFP subunit|nr:efflux RND transporter periplasmic adaptor subunit [Terriglobales bacterium]